MAGKQSKAKKERVDAQAADMTVELKQQLYQDTEERRLKEWENYQRSHRSAEDQKFSQAFLDISVGNVLSGRLVLELFDETVPITVQRFYSLVAGSTGADPVTGKKRDYLHCPLSCIDKERGLITFGEAGTACVDPIADENFALRHLERGLLTMISNGPHTSAYAFGVTLAPAPHLDFKQVVFGKIVDGIALLEKLEGLPTNAAGRPLSPAMISFCGALTGERPPGRWNQRLETDQRGDVK